MNTADPDREHRAHVARILIVDDHELARAGLHAMLSSEPDLQVVGEARSGAEVLPLCQELRPDLVLMDVRMPGVDGLVATRALKEVFPQISVVIVTIYENPDYLLQALRAGAAGYVLKDATQQQLVTAIRQLLRKEYLLHPGLMSDLLSRLAMQGSTPQHASLREQLTPRETAVLQLLAKGRTNREIAAELRMAVGTVKAHVEHILAKLSVSDRTQAAVRAIELGLVSGGGS